MFEKIKIGLSVAVILFAMCSIGFSQEDVALKRSIQIAKRGEKVECERCKTLNEDNAKFCRKCGIDLEKKKKEQRDIKCNKCGTTNSPDNKFCIECGRILVLETELKTEELSVREVKGVKHKKVGFKIGAFQPKDDHLHRLKNNWNVIGIKADILSDRWNKITLEVEYKKMDARYYSHYNYYNDNYNNNNNNYNSNYNNNNNNYNNNDNNNDGYNEEDEEEEYEEDEENNNNNNGNENDNNNDNLEKIQLENISLLLSYKIVKNKKGGKFIPYLGSGIGYHITKGEIGIYDSGWETKSETKREIGFHIFGGIEFPRNWHNIYVELRYDSVRRLAYFRELEDFEKDIKLSGITLMVGVKF